MTGTKSNPKIIKLPGNFGVHKKFDYSSQYNEILIKTDTGIFLISKSGSLIDSIEFPIDDGRLHLVPHPVAAYRNESSWQILLQENDRLLITQLPYKNDNRIYLEGTEANAKTAAWSLCGRFIAVGNRKDFMLTLWDTETGKQLWKNTAAFEVEGKLINPSSLSVTGWSSDGKRILTTTQYLAFCSIIIWTLDTGEIETILNLVQPA